MALMYSFDPAINYGPNDAGASAFTIAFVVIGFSLGIALLAAVYGFLANALKGIQDKDQK